MTMYGKDGLVRIWHPPNQLANGVTKLPGHIVTNRIGDIDGTGTLLDHCLHNTTQKVDLRTPGILSRKLYIIRVSVGTPHRFYRLLHHLIRGHAQLVFHVNG